MGNENAVRSAASDFQTSPSIIFVNRFFFPDHSATSQILSDLAFALAEAGLSIKIVAARGLYDDPGADLPTHECVRGVEIHRVFRARFGRGSIAGRAIDYLSMYRAFASAVGAIARAGDIVVAKTDPPLLSVALAPVARHRRAFLVNWLQDLYPEVALGLGMSWLKPFAPLLKAARNASLRSAVCNVAIGDLMAERLTAAGLFKGQVTVIPNWCDDQEIDPQLYFANTLREAWDLEGKFVVGYSGNLGRAHEYATVLGAAEQLKQNDNIVFLFIGGGQLATALKQEVQARGLDARFQFRPYQDAKMLPVSLTLPDIHWISLLPEMEGLIVPSKFYGIAAAGRPTVTITDINGEIARLVRSADCGFNVLPNDSQTLAELILRLSEDAKRVGGAGANAREMLRQRFTRSAALKNWRDLFENIYRANFHEL